MYILKTLTLGYELLNADRLGDLSDINENNKKLSENINSEYCLDYPTIEMEIKVYELNNTNVLMVFTLISKVDTDNSDPNEIKINWGNLRSRMEKVFTEYLKEKEVIYKTIISE